MQLSNDTKMALPRDPHVTTKAKSALPRNDKLSIYESKYTLRYDNNDVGRVFNGNMTYLLSKCRIKQIN